MKVEVVVLGSPSLINLMVSVDVKKQERRKKRNSLELGGCVNREVGLGSHSLSHSSPRP